MSSVFRSRTFDPVPWANSETEGPPLLIGDVVIAPDYVRRQADQYGSDRDDEIALMVAHGILHLLGYDHGRMAMPN